MGGMSKTEYNRQHQFQFSVTKSLQLDNPVHFTVA